MGVDGGEGVGGQVVKAVVPSREVTRLRQTKPSHSIWQALINRNNSDNISRFSTITSRPLESPPERNHSVDLHQPHFPVQPLAHIGLIFHTHMSSNTLCHTITCTSLILACNQVQRLIRAKADFTSCGRRHVGTLE